MSSIHLLPENLRNQIAAGEVVERPASVVKELVENAIDANANHIEVHVLKGGIEKMVIQDNGKGMDEKDAKMCFSRYATSKISTSDDLFSLHTFGFRGEAIAAIASVSKTSITTKTMEALSGIFVSGEEKNLMSKVIVCPKGTTITVENLFWNIPARWKFLKSESTEWREITKIMESFALSHPEISFRVQKDEKLAMDFPAFQNDGTEEIKENIALKNRIASLFGNEFTKSLLPLRYNGTDIQISGFCSHPHEHRASKDRQFLWVNGRSITGDKQIEIAVFRAYESLLPKGRKPSYFLSITLDPALVDVNVHPRKSEVRFLHSLYETVKSAFDHALQEEYQTFSNRENIHFPKTQLQSFNSFLKNEKETSLLQSHKTQKINNFPTSSPFSQKFPHGNIPQKNEQFSAISEIFPEHILQKRKVIGQIRKSFLVIEEDDGILIIDQHAVHERVRYEALMRNVQEKKCISQELLTPIIVPVSPSEKALLLSEQENLELLGFSITEFGERDIAISAVPSGTGERAVEQLVRDILEDLSNPNPKDGRETKKTLERIATYASCRGAIKFGDVLTLPEMESLVEKWEKCGRGFSCAHGRPVYKKIFFNELEHEHGR